MTSELEQRMHQHLAEVGREVDKIRAWFPDENELICEELLGWVRDCRESEPGWIEDEFWRLPDRTTEGETPSFTTWPEAGLILDAFRARGVEFEFGLIEDEWFFEIRDRRVNPVYELTGQAAIRAAALAYIKATTNV